MKRLQHVGQHMPWALLPLCLVASVAMAQQGEPVGRVVALVGWATVLHQRQPQAVPLALQHPVYQQDVIRTGPSATLKLRFVDDTVLSLGADATMQITDFVYSPVQQSQNTLLRMAKGIFRIVAGKLLPKGAFEVHTSNAVAAIRGTDWLGEVTADATAIVVLEGAVSVIHTRPEVQGQTLLTAGQGTDVLRDRRPTPAKTWRQSRVEALITATRLP